MIHFPVSNATFLFATGLSQLCVFLAISYAAIKAFKRLGYVLLLFVFMYFLNETINQIGTVILAFHTAAIGGQIPLNPILFLTLPMRGTIIIFGMWYFSRNEMKKEIFKQVPIVEKKEEEETPSGEK